MRKQTQANFKFRDIHSQRIIGQLLTVPDDSFTIKEILQRFTRGLDPMLTKVGEYDEEHSDEDFTMNPLRNIEDLTDITDIENFLEDIKERQNKLEKIKKDIQKEREKVTENSAT